MSNNMREKLIKNLNRMSYVYTDLEDTIIVEFTQKTVVYQILEDKLLVTAYDLDKNVIGYKEYKYARCAVVFAYNI
jgi:hypothetical protein